MPPNSSRRVVAAQQGRQGKASSSKTTKPTTTNDEDAAAADPRRQLATTTNPAPCAEASDSASSTASTELSKSPSSSNSRRPRRRQRQQQQQHEDEDDINNAAEPIATTSMPPPDDVPMEAYIPPELTTFVHPYHGDFCYSFHFHPQLIAQLMAEGFLPIATRMMASSTAAHSYVLLPKLHEQRCVIPLRPGAITALSGTAAARDDDDSSSGSMLHVSKSVRKKSSRYIMTCNASWTHVVEACQHQHGRSSWLYPPLVEALTHLHHRTASGNPFVAVIRSTGDGQGQQQPIRVPVRLYSIEVWREHVVEDEDGAEMNEGDYDRSEAAGTKRPHGKRESSSSLTSASTTRCTRRTLVAGELGYTVGAVYTSLTGFTNESGAGTIQLAALGRWLQQSGFVLWDLGMEMDYKFDLGAVLVPRSQFVQAVRELRLSPHSDAVLSSCTATAQAGGRNCRDVIDNKP